MPGFAGLFTSDGPVDEPELRRLAAPADTFFVEAGVGLAAPAFGEDRRVVAACDGQLVNARAVTVELLGAGHRFTGGSAAELVAHAYEEWGDDLVERLEGSFALAVWDVAKRRLLLARDRLGERPVYWSMLPRGGFVFGGGLRRLGAVSGVSRDVDPGVLARYLVHGHVPAPRALWRGVEKLEAGSRLVYTPGRTPIVERWWSLPLPRSARSPGRLTSASLAERELAAALGRAVQERLTDRATGVLLSGGLDSALVAALASGRRRELPSFSLSFDETDPAAAVAAHLGTRHRVERIGAADVVELATRSGELFDEPLGDAALLSTFLVARAARRHVDVALTGVGGDELFAGYPSFQAEKAASVLWDIAPAIVSAPVTVAAGLVARALPERVLDLELRQFLRADAAGRGAPERRHQAWLAPFLPVEARRVLAPELARQAAAHPDELWDVIDAQLRECPAHDPRDRLTWLYVRGHLADAVLPRLAVAASAADLELSSPFLDTRVVDLAARLHPALRLRGLVSKYALKRAARGLLPDAVIDEAPRGGPPIAAWLRGPLNPLVEELLLSKKLREDGHLAAAPIRKLVDEHRSGKDHGKALWTLLAFMLWRESYSGT